ncbi:MAG TPA: CUB domain-containing protein, partial [Bacteroidia bacterium]|nr:CUB domain-containing protein [Bacteroidia bacterium]
ITGTSQNFNLEYTTNNGTTWTRILTNYPSSTGTFAWQVPNTPSTNCKFKVMDYQNNAIVDQSDAVFTIGQAAEFVVTPNGGETWYAGTSQNITWVSMFNPTSNVKLEYSTNAGTSWTTITNSTPNTGSYAWTLPNTPRTTCLVRVSDAVTTTFNDVSNAVFTIAPHVTVNSPNGGNTFNGCVTTSLSWSHGGTSGLFNLHYSTNNGASWTAIALNYNGGAGPNTNYSWQVPNIGSAQFLVRVRDAADSLKSDVSNAVFTVNQTTNVVVVAPNGNENWIAGTTQSIMYSLNGGVTAVSLEYSTNGGTTWNTITSSSTGGSYNWLIPNVYSANALVRATDVSVACNSDVSNAPFTLTSMVTVNVPNGGELFPATVGPQGSNWVMNTITETMNTGNFYDAGGPTGNYTYTGTTIVKTFYPDVPVNKLRVAFNSFGTYNGSDYLRIYNGPTTASPVIGTYSGSSIPPAFTSTHATGALTFSWVTGSGYSGTGWDAMLTSIGGTTTQAVTWNIIGTSNTYNLEYSTNNGTSWIRILTNYPSSTGNFPWQVPNT